MSTAKPLAPAPVPKDEVLSGIRAGIEGLLDGNTSISLGHTTAHTVMSAAAADLVTYKDQQYCWAWPENRVGHVPGPYWGMTNYYWCCGAVVRWFYIGSAGVFDLRKFVPNWGAVKYLDAALDSGHLPFTRVGKPVPGAIACEFVNGIAQHTYICRSDAIGGSYTTYEGDTSNPIRPSSDTTGGYVNTRTRNYHQMNSGAVATHYYRAHWWVPPTPPPTPTPLKPLVLSSGMHDPCGSGTAAGAGNHIHALQAGLNKEFPAYPETPLAVDGIYGAHTFAAIRDFQGRAHLTVDGIAGPLTLRALLAAGVRV